MQIFLEGASFDPTTDRQSLASMGLLTEAGTALGQGSCLLELGERGWIYRAIYGIWSLADCGPKKI